jgi:hypothetical protein
LTIPYFNSTTAQSLACPYDQTFKVIYAYKAQEDTLYSYAANVKGYSEGELFTHKKIKFGTAIN